MAVNPTTPTTTAASTTQPTAQAAAPKSRSLLQQIQQNLAQIGQPTTQPGQLLGQTEALQRISAAATGKQFAPEAGVPARSQQAELQVVDQVKRGQEELAKQAQMQNLAFAQQQQATAQDEDFKNRLLSEDQINAKDKFLDTQRAILTDYANGKRELDLNKDKSRLEQLGFTMRLSNDAYLQELQKQASLANLSDALSFEEEMYRTVFAEEEDLLRNNLDFRGMLAADARQFKEEMGQMDINFALQMAEAENRALSERQMWDGISGLSSAAIQAYGAGGGNSTSAYKGPGSTENVRAAEQGYGVDTTYGGVSS